MIHDCKPLYPWLHTPEVLRAGPSTGLAAVDGRLAGLASLYAPPHNGINAGPMMSYSYT